MGGPTFSNHIQSHRESIMSFKEGDVVSLKSGSRSFTIVEVGEDVAVCLGFSYDGDDVYELTIPLVALKLED